MFGGQTIEHVESRHLGGCRQPPNQVSVALRTSKCVTSAMVVQQRALAIACSRHKTISGNMCIADGHARASLRQWNDCIERIEFLPELLQAWGSLRSFARQGSAKVLEVCDLLLNRFHAYVSSIICRR